MDIEALIARMKIDNEISPDPIDFRALRRKAKETMAAPADWAFSATGNSVVVTVRSKERGISVQAQDGSVATKVLLAAMDAYNEEATRMSMIKESAKRHKLVKSDDPRRL